ncbi:hypothetical protein BH09ACT1_BH09ACT1_09470 [soil metagenome]
MNHPSRRVAGCGTLVGMGIGTGIFLFVVGAILTFALNITTTVIDLDLVGYILMGAGVVVFVISLVLVLRRRSTVTTSSTAVDPNRGERIERRETRGDL